MIEDSSKKKNKELYDTVIVDTSDDLFYFDMIEDKNKKGSGVFDDKKLREIQNRYNNKFQTKNENTDNAIAEENNELEIVEHGEININEENLTNTHNDSLNIDFEQLLKIYFYNNYNKMISKNFSFAGFFFNFLYLLYRKMYLEYFISSLLFFAFVAVSIFLLNQNIVLGIIMFILVFMLLPILCGFFVNKLYYKKAYRDVSKIVISEPNNIYLIAKCAKKGGTSILSIFAIPSIILSFVILVVFIMSFFITFNTSKNLINKAKDKAELKDNVENSLNQSNLETNSNSVTVYYYDTQLAVKDVLDIKIPSSFEESITSDEDGNPIIYKVNTKDSTGIFNTCELDVSIIEKYSTSEIFLESKLGNNVLNSKIKTTLINGDKWHYFELNDSEINNSFKYSDFSYAMPIQNKKILYLNYTIGKDANKEECQGYFEEIKNSLKVK